MLANAGEDFAQISLRLDAVHLGGSDQGVENGGPLASGVAACDQFFLPRAIFTVVLPISAELLVNSLPRIHYAAGARIMF